MKAYTTTCEGFTLVEIMIVVSIIGLLSVISIPSIQKAYKRAKAVAFANDLRIFCDAAEYYMMVTRTKLEDSETGQMPAGWAGYVNADLWTGPTPIGGNWDTERDWGITFAIGVVAPDFMPHEMMEIDKIIDDGTLGSGSFRELAGKRYYYVIEE